MTSRTCVVPAGILVSSQEEQFHQPLRASCFSGRCPVTFLVVMDVQLDLDQIIRLRRVPTSDLIPSRPTVSLIGPDY